MTDNTVRFPNNSIKRDPREDPWAFIYKNFFGLAVYYSLIYARVTRHWELKDDFRNEMLYAMVEAYTKYRDRPLFEQIKIFKTIPRNYYGSKVNQKNLTIIKEPLENHAYIEDEDNFNMLYDKFYERFLDEHYKLNNDDITDEKVVLMEILYPSEEFQNFIKQEKSNTYITRAMLFKYFRMKYKWSKSYFDDVFENMRIAA